MADPASGSISPARTRSNVVLPEPFGATRATRSPTARVKVTFSKRVSPAYPKRRSAACRTVIETRQGVARRLAGALGARQPSTLIGHRNYRALPDCHPGATPSRGGPRLHQVQPDLDAHGLWQGDGQSGRPARDGEHRPFHEAAVGG